MASVSSPYGLVPVQLIGGQAFSGGTIRQLPMTTNSATGIFSGDLVSLVGGTAAAATATPTTTLSANTPHGVCVGVSYTDPVLKQTQYSTFLPAGAITAGYTNVFIHVVDDPDAVFRVQGNATTTFAASVGLNAALAAGAGSTTTGKSGWVLNVGTLAATATLAVRVLDIVDSGAAFPDLLVKFNVGVHAYNNGTGH